MKRKMLISIALVTIMLLNCIMPLIPVHADISSGDIVLNTKLYKAVKNELMAKNIPFTYSDTEKSISIDSEVMAQITKLNLNNKGLSNISGLENFTALTHLELSGNSLSEKSNLGCLSNLPLEYLDLSTNKIGDVSDIDGLISKINSNNGKVVLSNQSVSITATSVVKEDGTIKVELPKILSKAGFIKSSWKTITKEGPTGGPSVVAWPDRVSSEGTSLEFNTNLPGLLKLEIYIYDNPTEAESAANLNRASENVLFKSKFTIYVVVHPEETTAIHIPDVNMYREVRRQLTQGKIGNNPNLDGNIEADGYTPNKDLSSYPYAIDENGNVMYEECTFETEGELIHLTVVGTSVRKYTIDNGKVYLYGTTEVYTKDFEQTLIYAVDPATGDVSQKLGYKIPVNSENETLYDEAYNEPQVFVIKDQTLMNKITSLILNNKQIRDITGIEYFVGLKSDLNLSQNYLSNINPLYDLQKNKDEYEDKLQAKYRKYLLSEKDFNLSDALNKTTTAKNDADGNIKSISEAVNEIFSIFVDAAKIQKTKTNDEGETVENADYEKEINAKIEAAREKLKLIYGSTETDPVTGNVTETKGYIENLDENLLKVSGNLSYLYDMLSVLYDIYNNEYKLLTMLTDDMNYMDIEEYEKFDNLRKDVTNQDTDKALVVSQINKLKEFETSKNLTHLEKQLLSARFNINFEEEGTPLAKRFEEVDSPALIDVFREIALYSEMANYCTIKRMENPTVEGKCYCAEYLRNRIKEFQYEGIPTELEEKLLIYVENMDGYIAEYVADSTYETGDSLLDAYIKYCATTIPYTDGTDTIYKDTCHGEYDNVTKIERESGEYTSYSEIYDLLISRGMEPLTDSEANIQAVFEGLGDGIPKDFALYEYIRNVFKGEKDRLYLYEEAMTIANRLVKSNVERYVFLPKLKKLDVSYNADLDGIERISELKSLREFYANADYLGNIQDVNWEDLRYVRKLGLAYNYITDITCLNVLDHLVDLDVSHNLLAGRFEFSFENSQKTLQNLDLSYNQLDDITVIQEFLDIRTNGNYANYLAKDYTLNIYLNNQNLNIVVEEPINLKEFPSTVAVEMPKIFTQLLAIDTERTSFGITSEEGRIESEGTAVTLNTLTEGEKTVKVNVIAKSGNGKPVETCVGEGTIATIRYKVVNPKVTEVKVTPNENVVVKPGEELQFAAEVVGEDLFSTDVVWSVKDNQSENTTISNKGLLKIAEDEAAEKVVVEAKAKDDASKVVTIEVSTKEVAPENPGTTDPENPGTTDPENPGTTDPENPGTTDPENPGTTDPEVDVIDTDTLGYEAGEEFLTNVKAKTSIEDFERVLLNGKEYNVVVKKEDKDGNKSVVTEGNVGTGMYVQVQDENGNVIKDEDGHLVVYEIVVKGDVNGDGLANSLDSIVIKAYRNEVISLAGSAMTAADINEDGSVNISDSKLLLYHRAEVTGYDLNYQK